MFLLMEVCFVHLVLKDFDQETVQLRPEEMIMKSKTELSQYFINQWQLSFLDEGKCLLIKYSVGKTLIAYLVIQTIEIKE